MIRVAIIGTGSISSAHIEAYLALGNRCSIVALYDIIDASAQDKKRSFN